MEIVEFLRARLDEDAAMANSARLYEVETTSDLESTYPDLDFRSGVWWAVEGKHYDDGLIRLVKAEVRRGDDPTFSGPAPHVVVDDNAPEPVFRHIARHDPARVLREVESKRQIVDEYERQTQRNEENVRRCIEIGRHGWDDRLTNLRTHGWELSGRVAALKFAAQAYALIYSDHPDYDPEWQN